VANGKAIASNWLKPISKRHSYLPFIARYSLAYRSQPAITAAWPCLNFNINKIAKPRCPAKVENNAFFAYVNG